MLSSDTHSSKTVDGSRKIGWLNFYKSSQFWWKMEIYTTKDAGGFHLSSEIIFLDGSGDKKHHHAEKKIGQLLDH